VLILQILKVLCFDTLLQVFILKGVTGGKKSQRISMTSGLGALRFALFLRSWEKLSRPSLPVFASTCEYKVLPARIQAFFEDKS
jgi:hypothetical protein